MRKQLVLLVIVIVCVFLIGCQSSNQDGFQQNFKQGISELQVQFVENAPPQEIYPNSRFKIIADVDNQAAYIVQNIKASIIGLDPKYFLIEDSIIELESLEGRSQFLPSGDKEFFEYDGTTEGLLFNAEEYRGPFTFLVSYDSDMQFADTICLNPNLYEVFGDVTCEVQKKKNYNGQGAPLAITTIEEITFPGHGAEVEFRIELQNRGKGEVGNIRLQDARLGTESIDCEFQGTSIDKLQVKFKKKEQQATLICRKKFLDRLNSYSTTLVLDFTYDYILKVQGRLNLVR